MAFLMPFFRMASWEDTLEMRLHDAHRIETIAQWERFSLLDNEVQHQTGVFVRLSHWHRRLPVVMSMKEIHECLTWANPSHESDSECVAA